MILILHIQYILQDLISEILRQLLSNKTIFEQGLESQQDSSLVPVLYPLNLV